MKSLKNKLLSWKRKKLGNCGIIQSGGTPDTNKKDYWQGTIPWITPSEVTGLSKKFVQKTERYLTEKGLKDSSAVLLPSNSLIICTRATVGNSCINVVPMCTNQGFKNLIPNSENDVLFLYYLIENNKKDLIRKACGSTFLEISKKDIVNLSFLMPPTRNEQEKIVEVLECWDKGIELVKKLIEQKELQKKGLLQNLVYNQPTCKNFYLGNLFSLGRGRVISKEEIQHNKGTYPVYSSQTSDNGILGYINSFDFEGEYLTWTTDGANAGKVFYRRGQFNCTNVCGTAKPHNSNLVNLYYVMSYLNKVTKRYVSYVGNPKLMNGVFSKIAIPLPEKTTQDWAATVLETADKEIDLLKQKLAKLEAQKKGLMQVLLTGKIRLK